MTLLGHSMGVAVIWAYLDLFGPARLDRLVLADSADCASPRLVRRRGRSRWSSQTPAELDDLCHRLRAPDGWDVLVEVLLDLASPDLSPERFEALLATNRPTANETQCAALWYDQCTVDWRDLIPTITVPTIVVHGLGSMIPLECQQWIATSIPGARLATIPAEEGGSHFAFGRTRNASPPSSPSSSRSTGSDGGRGPDYRAMERASDRVEAEPPLVVEEPGPFTKATRLADSYGFEACGRGEDHGERGCPDRPGVGECTCGA